MEATDVHTIEFKDLPNPKSEVPTVNTIAHGKTMPPQQQILSFSPADWEEFVNEWAHHQKTNYTKVVRFTGAGDMGIDIAGFTDDKAHHGVWDCYQCKHYSDALTPTTAYPEIAKIIWYSFNNQYSPPRKYYFMAPWECGKTLKSLLLVQDDLKRAVIDNWDKHCAGKIKQGVVKREGDFANYLEAFDFSIFTFKKTLDLIDEHKRSPYFTHRFGGGLPDRPDVAPPPTAIQQGESRYIEQLCEVYSEETNSVVSGMDDLIPHKTLLKHLDRQRECFYAAEALRNFARETVPAGTFENLQNEFYDGVVEVEQSGHATSRRRLDAVLGAVVDLQVTSNGLITATKMRDRKGICHQLANDDRLKWKH